MSDLRAHRIAPTALWLTVVGTAALGNMVSEGLAAAIAAGGVAAAITLLGGPLLARALIAGAMVPAAFVDSAPALAFVATGGAVGIATSLFPEPRRSPSVGQLTEIQRHLAWCRRREDNAHLLVMPLTEREAEQPGDLLDCFRITDSVALSRGPHGLELHALLDDKNFQREGLESRLGTWAGDERHFGWAHFPQDAVTVQALVEGARASMPEAALRRGPWAMPRVVQRGHALFSSESGTSQAMELKEAARKP
jgi:hypothetical protein